VVVVVVEPPPPPPPLLPATEAERLDEAAGLLADGERLERVGQLLEAVAPGAPRRDQLLGQLAELLGDDAGALAAYDRALAGAPDAEVRLRRALVLQRLGREAEARAELDRLQAEPPPAGAPVKRPPRKLRPLKPSSR
jgi:tetratricopeptide (TPR) repeat protein